MNHQLLIDDIKKLAEKELSTHRFNHIKRVAALCGEYALRFGLDHELALIAGWGHDLAREWETDEMIDFLVSRDQILDPVFIELPIIAHGRVAVYVIKEKFGFENDQVSEAIEHHTLGKSGMGEIARLLFCADYLEPGRTFIDDDFRKEINKKCLDCILKGIIEHTIGRGKPCHPRTMDLLQSISVVCERTTSCGR